MRQLAETIIGYADSGSQVVYRDLPRDDPKVRLPDITKARRELGWEPVVMPEDGLKRTIEWFREEIARRETGDGR